MSKDNSLTVTLYELNIFFPYYPRFINIVYPSPVKGRRGYSYRVKKPRDFLRLIRAYNGVAHIFPRVYDEKYRLHILFFDIDSASLEESLAYARDFISMLRREKLQYSIVFSGRRGFHIYVFTNTIQAPDENTARIILDTVMKYLAEDSGVPIKPGDGIDPQKLGSPRATCRMFNTMRPDTRLYTVFLPCDIGNITVEEVLSMAVKPSIARICGVKRLDLGEYIFTTSSETMEAKQEIEKPAVFKTRTPLINFSKIGKPSLAKILSKLVRPCILRKVLEPNPTHEARTYFVIELAWLELSIDEIVEIISKLDWIDYDEKTTRYHVSKILEKVIYKRLMPPSCNTLKRKGFCLGQCDWFYYWVIL